MRERTGESQLLVLLREKSVVWAEGRNHTHTLPRSGDPCVGRSAGRYGGDGMAVVSMVWVDDVEHCLGMSAMHGQARTENVRCRTRASRAGPMMVMMMMPQFASS